MMCQCGKAYVCKTQLLKKQEMCEHRICILNNFVWEIHWNQLHDTQGWLGIKILQWNLMNIQLLLASVKFPVHFAICIWMCPPFWAVGSTVGFARRSKEIKKKIWSGELHPAVLQMCSSHTISQDRVLLSLTLLICKDWFCFKTPSQGLKDKCRLANSNMTDIVCQC